MQQQGSIGQMHKGQWHVAAETVERLVGQQFSQWRELPVSPVLSHGTVNALFRLGDRMVVRFDLVPSADPRRRAELVAAQENVIRLARQVTVQVPVPLAVGKPGDGYPGYWTVYEWIPGKTVHASPASRAAHISPELPVLPDLPDLPCRRDPRPGSLRPGPCEVPHRAA